jgi:hypothetical protein
MEKNAQTYLKFLLGIGIGVLFIWLGVTGRLGSLLGAIITPGYMIEGTPPSPDGSTSGNVNTSAEKIVPSSGKLTDVQIAQYAVTAGLATYTSIATSVAIAIAESQGNVSAHNPGNGTTDIEDSYGLWQINVLAHSNYDKSKLYDPAYNAAAMVSISSGGTNWNPWGTYTSGAYRKYMDRGVAAANNVFKGI